MAKKTDNNQTGMIVFLRSPIPNSLNEPSIEQRKKTQVDYNRHGNLIMSYKPLHHIII